MANSGQISKYANGLKRILDNKWIPLIILLIVSINMIKGPIQEYNGGFWTAKNLQGDGDAILYFSWVHSIVEDGDFHFADDYAELGPKVGDHLKRKLPSGYLENFFPPGPSILWSPFYIGAKAILAVTGVENREKELDLLMMSAFIGTTVYSALFLFLMYDILLRFAHRWFALISSIAIYQTTAFIYYVDHQRLYSHTLAAFAVTLFIWLLIRKKPEERSYRYWALIGLTWSLTVTIRLLDGLVGIWLLTEQLPIMWEHRKKPLRLIKQYASFALGAALLLVPVGLMISIMYAGATPYETANTFWPEKPHLFETLFASRHGLLSWHPVVLLSFIGIGMMLGKSTRDLGIKTLVLLLFALYINACVGDWFAGAAFGMRRFISFSVVIGIGFAALFKWRNWIWRGAIIALLITGVFWNNTLVANCYKTNEFIDIRPRTANPLDEDNWYQVNTWGMPLITPWMDIGALRHGIPADVYDWLLSYSLDRRQHHFQGRIEPWMPSFQGDFIEPREDAKGEFRALNNVGKVFFNTHRRHPKGFLVVAEMTIGRHSIPQERRPCVLIYVNGKPAGIYVKRRAFNIDAWGSFFLPDKEIPWKHGLNTMEMHCGTMDRKQRPGPELIKAMFENPEKYSIELGKENYWLLVREIRIRQPEQ